MRSVEAILSDTNDNRVQKRRKQTVEIDVDALENAGRWGATKLEIGGKIYQLFPLQAA